MELDGMFGAEEMQMISLRAPYREILRGSFLRIQGASKGCPGGLEAPQVILNQPASDLMVWYRRQTVLPLYVSGLLRAPHIPVLLGTPRVTLEILEGPCTSRDQTRKEHV